MTAATPTAVSPTSSPTTPASGWTLVCTLDDVPVLGSRRVARAQGAPVALFRTAADEVFALLDRCPHRGGPLSQGIVFGQAVACPLHNWTIGLQDGRAQGADEGCTPRFKVKREDSLVYLDAGELATLGIDLPLPVAGPCATRGAGSACGSSA